MIRYKKDTDNIVTLTFDMTDRPINVLNHELTATFMPVIKYLQEEKKKKQLCGIILTSAKKTFMESGDLEYLYQTDKAEEIYQFTIKLKNLFRDIERPGVPVVAAINGTALGTGFELILACHYRIAVNNAALKVGFPEIRLGLMPNGGGLVRLLWLVGIEKAFNIATSAQLYPAQEALQLGILDDLAKNEVEMMEKAKAWLLSNPNSGREWDLDTNITYFEKRSKEEQLIISRLAAEVARQYNNNFRAPQSILNALSEAAKVDFDTAMRIESRYYTELLCHPQSKNMIKTFWFDYLKIKKGLSRPKGFGKFRPRKVGIIGAGAMGSGIALCCLQEGMEVVLKDVNRFIAQRGQEYVTLHLKALEEKKQIDSNAVANMLQRLQITENAADFTTCDIIIEAVFENENVKSKVIREAEQHMDEYSIFASNTVSLPISRISKVSSRPENFVGLHFFHPVPKKIPVEVVRGEHTSEETVAKAFDFVRALQKYPIVVNDNWGFYTNRVQNTYILEGIQLLKEGVPASIIENLSRKAGMPKAPLSLADELSLELVNRYEQQAATIYGKKYLRHPATEVLEKMLDELERTGQKKQMGFYTYSNNGKQLWEGLEELYPKAKKPCDRKEIMERLLFVQVLEAAWCRQEKVITTTAEANLGSVFGWGFPAFTGGVFQFIKDYGHQDFIEKCKQYEKKYGPRYKVPTILVKNAEILSE